MIQFRMYFDKDKETKWLNEMAEKGYAMIGFCLGVYRFAECEPGEYIYQIDISEGFFCVHSSYREFMSDAGVEIVCLWGPWVFLRRKASEGPFELYTDVESTIVHYTKIRRLFKVLLIMELCCLFLEIMGGIRGVMAGWAFACLIAAFIVIFAKQVVHLNEMLYELRSRIGETEECGIRGRQPSGVLAVGMLVNFCALMIDNPVYEFVKGFLTGLAIVLILTGIVLTFWKRNK